MILKFIPEDFYVKEIVNLDLKPLGDKYQYFILWKRNLTTIKAIKIVSKKLGISWRRINFAGEKDKRAITEQIISIENLTNFREYYDFGDIKLSYIGSYNDPISSKDIVGNEFRIVVRSLSEKELENFDKNVKIFDKGFINYFDDQRFGLQRPINHLIGKAILKKDWEKAVRLLLTYTTEKENKKSYNARVWLDNNWGRWREALSIFPKWLDIERKILDYLYRYNDFYRAFRSIHPKLQKLFINSYQSYLWNLAVNKLVEKICNDAIKISTSIGSLSIPSSKDCLYSLQNYIVPIIGYDTQLDIYPTNVKSILEELINEESITLDDFRNDSIPSLSFKGDERKVVQEVRNLSYNIEDDIVILKFFLPKGAYATMYVKHLFANR